MSQISGNAQIGLGISNRAFLAKYAAFVTQNYDFASPFTQK